MKVDFCFGEKATEKEKKKNLTKRDGISRHVINQLYSLSQDWKDIFSLNKETNPYF